MRFHAGSILETYPSCGGYRYGYRDDVEAFAHYSFQAWYKADKLKVGGGFFGHWLASEKGDFNELSTHEFGISVINQYENFQPALTLRVPVDKDLDRVLDYVFGLSCTFFVD